MIRRINFPHSLLGLFKLARFGFDPGPEVHAVDRRAYAKAPAHQHERSRKQNNRRSYHRPGKIAKAYLRGDRTR